MKDYPMSKQTKSYAERNARYLHQAKTVVIKVGSANLIDQDNNQINADWLAHNLG